MSMQMGKHSDQFHPHHQLKSQKSTKHKRKPLKIKYISSPRMVEACNATEFRAIVQELTGQNSRIMDPFYTYFPGSVEDSSQICDHGAPQLEMNVESADGAFLNNPYSFQAEMKDGSFWRDFPENLFEPQSSCVFV